jgi:hypothetical protein
MGYPKAFTSSDSEPEPDLSRDLGNPVMGNPGVVSRSSSTVAQVSMS